MDIVKKWTEFSLILKIVISLIIGVIQDSCETALNSAGNLLFSATAEYHDRMKSGENVNYLGEFAK